MDRKGTTKLLTEILIRDKLTDRKYYAKEVTLDYGNRLNLGIDKDHHLDACIIASGGKSFTFVVSSVFVKRDVAKGDYQKTKGVRSEQPITTGKIQGFRKFDKVQYLGKEYFVKGRMSTGYAVLMDIEGSKIDFSYMPKGLKTPKLSSCRRVAARSSQMIQTAPA